MTTTLTLVLSLNFQVSLQISESMRVFGSSIHASSYKLSTKSSLQEVQIAGKEHFFYSIYCPDSKGKEVDNYVEAFRNLCRLKYIVFDQIILLTSKPYLDKNDVLFLNRLKRNGKCTTHATIFHAQLKEGEENEEDKESLICIQVITWLGSGDSLHPSPVITPLVLSSASSESLMEKLVFAVEKTVM